MNNAGLVLDLVNGEKRLTVTVYDKELTLKEQLYPKKETKIIIKGEDGCKDDLENLFVVSHICTGGNRRVAVPLNFDEIHGFDDLLNLLCALTSYGKDCVFHLYNTDGEMTAVYLVTHQRGCPPEIQEVNLLA